ncbi:MAG: hypothetical protein ACOVSI_15320 [Gemmatimonas sp.]|jgi:hypothetical protein
MRPRRVFLLADRSMARCPYTWVRSFFSAPVAATPGEPARHLRVRVVRDGEERVLVTLPAGSARWLMEVIPKDVQDRIRAEAIPLDAMMEELHEQTVHYPRQIFTLTDAHRQIDVWLE